MNKSNHIEKEPMSRNTINVGSTHHWPLWTIILFSLAVLGLAGCGGGGSSSGGPSSPPPMTITPPPSGDGPDLIIQSTSVSDDTLTPGEQFTLSVTVRNQGDSRSAATTLRYKTHANLPILSGDPTIGTDSVPSLDPSSTASESISVTAPSTPGTYHYGACVDTVSSESDTENNCSGDAGVSVTVSNESGGGSPGGGPPVTVTWPCPFSSGGSITVPATGTVYDPDNYLTVYPYDAKVFFLGNTCGNYWVGSSNLSDRLSGDLQGYFNIYNTMGREDGMLGIEFRNPYNTSGQTVVRQYTIAFCEKRRDVSGGYIGEHCYLDSPQLSFTSTITVRWLPGE